MGLKHGGYYLDCCWTLMGLLFAFGVMNLLWVAGITHIVIPPSALDAVRAELILGFDAPWFLSSARKPGSKLTLYFGRDPGCRIFRAGPVMPKSLAFGAGWPP
jgi:hypothetical protein